MQLLGGDWGRHILYHSCLGRVQHLLGLASTVVVWQTVPVCKPKQCVDDFPQHQQPPQKTILISNVGMMIHHDPPEEEMETTVSRSHKSHILLDEVATLKLTSHSQDGM